MNRISISHRHPRPCSGAKTLKKCRNHEERDNVIVIDLDADSFDNVVIIDVPESLPSNTQRSSLHKKHKMPSVTNVICIDDDENNVAIDSFGANGARFHAGASSNRESYRASTKDSAPNESTCDQDATRHVRISNNSKRTYSGKGSTRNRYGFDIDYESDSSDSDYLDCELVVDSSGDVQEQWEKASFKRKKDFQNGHLDIHDHDISSRADCGGDYRDFEMDDANMQRKEAPSSSRAGKFSSRKDDASCSGTEEGFVRESRENWESPFLYSFVFSEQSHNEFDRSKTVSRDEESSGIEPHFTKSKPCSHEDPSHGKSSRAEDETTVSASKNSFEIKTRPSESLSGDYSNEANVEEDNSATEVQLENDDDDGETLPLGEPCLISEREKLKETNEYKRAMEEEWASRQRAIQVQAEEANHLRRLQKRRVAESMRLLDMERRQKERIEEVRNTQRKDEENMNLKERIRVEVRMELEKLKVSCHDMASLLHSLGVRVSGWPYPESQEVQTAYKRALLTFHPDRTSQSDICQQVEAEEKFKLINQLKEKLPLSL